MAGASSPSTRPYTLSHANPLASYPKFDMTGIINIIRDE